MRLQLISITFASILFGISCLSQPLDAAEASPCPSKWALGMIYPGASIKYFTVNHAWEYKAQVGSGILTTGPRYYQYLNSPESKLRLFWGLEADIMTFKNKTVKGSGFAAGWFAGGELMLDKSLGFSMDFGPMYLNLAEDKYSEASSGVDYVINMGLYWHFK
jgi:hypothetical protein